MTIRPTQISLLYFVFLIAPTVAAGQSTANPATGASSDDVAKQIGMLRQSVQSLDATLNDIADKLIPVFTKAKDAAAETQGRISSSFTLLAQAEQRAEICGGNSWNSSKRKPCIERGSRNSTKTCGPRMSNGH